MPYAWIFTLVVIFAIAAVLVRRITLQKLLKEIYVSAYVKKDQELFLLHINSPQAKMLMSQSARLLIKLNYYIATDNEEKVVKMCEQLRHTRMDKNNTKAFYSTAIGYYTEKQRPDALALLQELKQKSEHSKDQALILLYMDSQLLYDIYIRKDKTKIAFLQEMINSDLDPDTKAICRIRLARLYSFTEEETASKHQLQLAYQEGSEQVKKKVSRILKEGW